MYYLYYGIWFGIKSRLSDKVVMAIQLSCLALVALVGLGMMFFAIHLMGVF